MTWPARTCQRNNFFSLILLYVCCFFGWSGQRARVKLCQEKPPVLRTPKATSGDAVAFGLGSHPGSRLRDTNDPAYVVRESPQGLQRKVQWIVFCTQAISREDPKLCWGSRSDID